MHDRWLIAGLGNPGKKYHQTRHNIGFLVLDRFAQRFSASFANKSKFRGHVVQIARYSGDLAVTLLKPDTFMNLSGESLVLLQRHYRVPAAQCIVVHDEVDIDFGRIQIKCGGGHAGHNGLRSIHQCLATPDYCRLRMGVGRPADARIALASFVLAKFTPPELAALDQQLDHACDALDAIIRDGPRPAMNHYNG